MVMHFLENVDIFMFYFYMSIRVYGISIKCHMGNIMYCYMHNMHSHNIMLWTHQPIEKCEPNFILVSKYEIIQSYIFSVYVCTN